MEAQGQPVSRLPRVEQSDLLDIVFDELMDPDSQNRWRVFSQSNPELARELHVRAFQKLRQLPEQPSSVELSHVALSLVTYAVTALEKAMERQTTSEALESETPPSPAA